jgi:hypothetical protein
MRHLVTLVAAVVASLVLVTTATASPAEKVARTITALWSCQDAIGQKRTKAGNVWAKHSPGYRQWQLLAWQGRLEQCRQWNWQSWLPANWVAVARCETGINWSHYNGSYRSAFGISTREYDADARYKGVRGWFDGPKPPTPWEQYQAALGHYERFGDGWGCPGP